MTSTLTHLPLERYRSRYTEDLQHWESEAFERTFNVTRLTPALPHKREITSGEVLDAIARPTYSMLQMGMLLSNAPYLGTVYFSDFYTPGLDVLPYSRCEFKAASFCWAQTFDQYDFTRKLFINWMRPWEIMAFEIYSRVYVACPELADLIGTALPHVADKVKVVGLPYNHRQVFGQLRTIPTSRSYDVVYASRWDTEKNPSRFLDLVQAGRFKGVVCTGHPRLQGTDQAAIARAYEMAELKQLTILSGLERADYFLVLASSHVIFNCGDQDWISYTLLDALTFGCAPLYPAHRSFPRALYWDENYLYPPGDIDTATEKVSKLITDPPRRRAELAAQVLSDHDSALDRICDDLHEL